MPKGPNPPPIPLLCCWAHHNTKTGRAKHGHKGREVDDATCFRVLHACFFLHHESLPTHSAFRPFEQHVILPQCHLCRWQHSAASVVTSVTFVLCRFQWQKPMSFLMFIFCSAPLKCGCIFYFGCASSVANSGKWVSNAFCFFSRFLSLTCHKIIQWTELVPSLSD